MAAGGGVWTKGAFFSAAHIEFAAKFYHDTPPMIKADIGRMTAAEAAEFKKELDDGLADEAANEAALAKLGGPPTAAAVQAAQSVEAKISDQKYESAHFFDVDGNTVLAKDGNKNSVVFDDADVQKMAGTVLTHNHPSGGSFSPEDIALGSTGSLKEVRAIGTNPLGEQFIHRMRPPKGKTWPDIHEIQMAVSLADSKIKAKFWPKISSGQMSIAEANAYHWHEVWTIASKNLGLVYEREKLN